MIKRPFLAFVLVVGSLVAGLIWFIQSPQFAHVFKTFAFQYLPREVGVEGDFSDLSVKLFPPGFSINHPKIKLRQRNIVNLPEGSSVEAERMDFVFRPFQIFSGNIRVQEINIINGNVHLKLNQSLLKKKMKRDFTKFDIHWDDLFHIRAEAIALQNVNLDLQVVDSPLNLKANARVLRISQWKAKGGMGFSLSLDLRQIEGSYLKELYLPSNIDVQGEAYVNALGLHLQSLLFSNPIASVRASGQVKGNLLDPKALDLSAIVNVQGEVDQILKAYPSLLPPKQIPQGQLVFEGKVQGDLKKPLDSLAIEGSVDIKKFKYQEWASDSVHLEGKWESSVSGGQVTLKKGILLSKEAPRANGEPGAGGKIEVGAASWKMGSQAPIQVPLSFDRVHVHWLGAPAVKTIYPMDFRLSGKIEASFIPSPKKDAWELHASLKTWVDQFVLDNQKLHQVKKSVSTVFSVPRIGVDGSVKVNSKGIYPSVVVSMNKTHLQTSGEIDFRSGYNLRAEGPLVLQDLGRVAENPIQGEGNAHVHVRGPLARTLVDIDVNLTQARYLDLALGNVKGRLTWDDDPQHLIFSGVQGTKEKTLYLVNGKLDVGQSKSILLDAQFPSGNIQDMVQIFGRLTQSLWWFPHSVNGPFDGNLRVEGGISLQELKVLGQINGNSWEYLGEHFKKVSLSGGYDRGRYSVDSFNAIKRSGKVFGKVVVEVDGKIDWDLRTEDFTVNDMDLVSQLDVPLRGVLKIQSSGHTVRNQVDSLSEFSLESFSIKGVRSDPSRLVLSTANGVAKLSSSVFGGQGLVDLVYYLDPKQKSSVKAEFKDLDFSPVVLLLNPKLSQDKELKARLSGLMDLTFRSDSAASASGLVTLSDYSLANSNSDFELVEPKTVKIENGNFSFKDLAVRGDSGETTVELSSAGGTLHGNIEGGVDISILEYLTSAAVQTAGTADLDFAIEGTITNPELFGSARLNGASLQLEFLDSPFENLTGSLLLRQNKVTLQNVQTDVGGGKIGLGGKIELFPNRFPEVLLNVALKAPKLKVFPFQFARVNGFMNITGSEFPYLATGKIIVDSALCREKILSRKGSDGKKTAQYAPPQKKARESSQSKLKLNVEVEAQNGVMIQNDLFNDMSVRGSLQLVNTIEAPRILGRVEVAQGKLRFKDHLFQIQMGAANFDNPTAINPSFDLTANTEVNGTKIQMYATGRSEKIKIEFTSNPSLQESEILSLLAVGLTSSDAKRLSATDLSALQHGEAASLLLHSLDFNRDFEEKTGFHVQLDQVRNRQQGVSVFRPQTQAEALAAPQITIRRRLGSRLSLSAGSTVGVGTSRANQANLDFMVNPGFSVTGVVNNYSQSNTTVNTVNTDLQNQYFLPSFGLDLRFQKRFK